jgi:aldose 1-epimerase
MRIKCEILGSTAKGREVRLYTVKVGEVEMAMADYGATLVSFKVPAGKSKYDDVLLGFSSLDDFETSDAYFGATVGRYANRIARAKFSIDGHEYRLAANNGPNHLHGGLEGFNRRLWKTFPFEESGRAGLRFELTSPAGDEGYPGELKIAVTYSLSPDAALDIKYEAETDAPTVLGPTNHAYFNLKGNGQGTILDHELRLQASRYLPVDADLIPTGELAPVSGGPFDFIATKTIGRDIASLPGGYDHCFVIDRKGSSTEDGELQEIAELREPSLGRELFVATTMPGIQLYTGNFLTGVKGKGGIVYQRHSGLCLETEMFPDSPNRSSFPTSLLRPGEKWKQATRYRFAF